MLRVSLDDILRWKGRRPRPVVLTAVDYPTGRLLDQAGLDMIHVGDSLGMVVLGYADTSSVTLQEMLHHLRAVARGVRRALITADIPAECMTSPHEALRAARALLENGAHAVKVEGGRDISDIVFRLVEAGIPLQGHVGLLPQRVALEGGYRRKGRSLREAEQLLEDSLFLQKAGCFSVVLECVIEDVAREITRALQIPTIGIYSGRVCDAEIRVLHDVIGLTPWSRPSSATVCKNLAEAVRQAVTDLAQEINRVDD